MFEKKNINAARTRVSSVFFISNQSFKSKVQVQVTSLIQFCLRGNNQLKWIFLKELSKLFLANYSIKFV